jgi:hypothetical protein
VWIFVATAWASRPRPAVLADCDPVATATAHFTVPPAGANALPAGLASWGTTWGRLVPLDAAGRPIGPAVLLDDCVFVGFADEIEPERGPALPVAEAPPEVAGARALHAAFERFVGRTSGLLDTVVAVPAAGRSKRSAGAWTVWLVREHRGMQLLTVSRVEVDRNGVAGPVVDDVRVWDLPGRPAVARRWPDE